MIRTFTRYVFVRYVVSGGSAACVDLGLLYVLNSVFSVYYIVAAILAFMGAFGVSFTLHKIWTFKGPGEHETSHQVMLYLVTSLFGLGLNTLLMYLFVDHAHLRVLVAQIFAGGLVACCTFFISRNFVFKHQIK